MSKILNISMSRRQFLGMSAASAGVFVLGVSLPMGGRFAEAAAKASDDNAINAFIAITEDGHVIFQNPFIEMGQGTYTSIPTIVAEELDILMDVITVEQAPHGPEYRVMFNNTTRLTGGSLSVRSSYDRMRQIGATARHMLIEAAAKTWEVPASECSTEPGVVLHKASGKQLSYGELASIAATLEPPEKVSLKDPSQFRLIGKPVKRTDSLAKATGTAEFGMDIQVDGMVHAAVKQCPTFGGKVKSFDASKVMNLPGVISVDTIPNGIAVIAQHYWQAKQALDTLPVEFDSGVHSDFSSAGYLKTLQSRLDDPGVPAEDEGDVAKALAGAAKTVTADYHVPFLAHATMEPMNCTALVQQDQCTVWAPNQGADPVAAMAQKITGLPLDAIDVQTPFLGGGFGRRFVLDYAEQAITLANKHKGQAIKVIWTREEDTQHDHYRPMMAARHRAGFDEQGKLIAHHVTNVGEGPMARLNPQFLKNPDIDDTVVEGAEKQPYAIPNKRVDFVLEAAPQIPLGYWRSVGNSINGFIKESFMDELAHAANSDPVEFRRSLLTQAPRYKKLLDTAVQMANWTFGIRDVNGSKRAMGVAMHECFGSLVAQVADVSIENGDITVHDVWCSVDCGFAVNPRIIAMQMESSIAFGLSAALAEEITINNGKVDQSNFHTYAILPPQKMPKVHVEIINSGEAMGGIGEPGTPPIAPAVCNALFTLTGKRVRSLPLSQHSFA